MIETVAVSVLSSVLTTLALAWASRRNRKRINDRRRHKLARLQRRIFLVQDEAFDCIFLSIGFHAGPLADLRKLRNEALAEVYGKCEDDEPEEVQP